MSLLSFAKVASRPAEREGGQCPTPRACSRVRGDSNVAPRFSAGSSRLKRCASRQRRLRPWASKLPLALRPAPSSVADATWLSTKRPPRAEALDVAHIFSGPARPAPEGQRNGAGGANHRNPVSSRLPPRRGGGGQPRATFRPSPSGAPPGRGSGRVGSGGWHHRLMSNGPPGLPDEMCGRTSAEARGYVRVAADAAGRASATHGC